MKVNSALTRNMLWSMCCFVLLSAFAAKEDSKKNGDSEKSTTEKSSTYSALKFRSVGPALTSGRIADIAVVAHNPSTYYVAAASGGVWKTENAGVTFSPIFDSQSSYSIGCLAIDPKNENIIWVGSGENNNQRSVAYGDGLYKSLDGGKSWKNVGLKNSEHIGMIAIHPENSNVVFVAAYGPLWSAGGDRGIYMTTDGGDNWEKVLEVSEHTGFNEVHFDREDPSILYATAHQRRRHVFTYISGGPESAIYKSTDGGTNWKKLSSGLPKGDVGRIGLALPPSDPNRIYAIIEATDKTEGVYRSDDKGESWKKLDKYTTSGNYYVELVPDPVDADKVYSMDTYCHFTEDGGKTWKKLNEKYKHVDNHAMWINPKNTNHYIMGCDGGLYETFDNAQNWQFKPNLPITQFYKVSIDQAEPFYNIYGGTQDNFSLGGPSQTLNASGITNADWFVTNGGDGFETQVDPEDPTIVYAQAQYGYLVRHDRVSGERLSIKPTEGKEDEALRWNWDAPLLISPHDNKTLYFCANKVFKSTDRGNSWQLISGDLSRQIDRNKLKVMGKVWSVDAVSKNRSTTIYGNLVAFDESPVQKGLLYAGSDDGLIHVSENDGESWSKLQSFPTVPETTYVNMLLASQHKANRVYAVFNNHKNGDFKPYVLVSEDNGKNWKSISANLPEAGAAYAIREDHVDPNLLFVGTEFGVFFSQNRGESWVQLKSGLPTIAVRDIEIHKGENDLVLGTFGRGFYVLDDYSPLRTFTNEIAEKDGFVFPKQEGLIYIEAKPLGLREKSFQGASLYTAENPPIGIDIRYYQKEKIKSLAELRQEKETELAKENGDVFYPEVEALRKEDDERKPYVFMSIMDTDGNEIKRIKCKNGSGIQSVVWDGRYPNSYPANPNKKPYSSPYYDPADGPFVVPGAYKAQLKKYQLGEITALSEPQEIEIKALNMNPLGAKDKAALLAFQKEVQALNMSISSAQAFRKDLDKKVDYLITALEQTPGSDLELVGDLVTLEQLLKDIDRELNGDYSLSKREFETKTSISSRLGSVIYNLWRTTSAPTSSQKENIAIAAAGFQDIYKKLVEADKAIKSIEATLDEIKAPYTPGRLINYLKE